MPEHLIIGFLKGFAPGTETGKLCFIQSQCSDGPGDSEVHPAWDWKCVYREPQKGWFCQESGGQAVLEERMGCVFPTLSRRPSRRTSKGTQGIKSLDRPSFAKALNIWYRHKVSTGVMPSKQAGWPLGMRLTHILSMTKKTGIVGPWHRVMSDLDSNHLFIFKCLFSNCFVPEDPIKTARNEEDRIPGLLWYKV